MARNKGGKEDEHIISMLVEDRMGTLQRIACVFSKRNFNMDTITVGKTEMPGLSRVTITTRGDEKTVEQIVKQLNKLVDVIKVSEMDESTAVIREIAMVKVHVKDFAARSEIMNYSNIFRGRVVDVSPKSITIEVTGTPSKIEAFVDLIKPFGIKEFVRTGVTALARD
ncbi:MAG: acetolactate synthase small subunit [Candidatus Micrarchaeia archaeon]